jgi:hypothetical protein
LLFGSFFIAVAILGLAWAMLVLFRPSPAVYLAGFVGTAAVAATSLVSRTNGLPLGPESGEPEPVGVAGTLATASRWRSRSSRSRSIAPHRRSRTAGGGAAARHPNRSSGRDLRSFRAVARRAHDRSELGLNRLEIVAPRLHFVPFFAFSGSPREKCV